MGIDAATRAACIAGAQHQQNLLSMVHICTHAQHPECIALRSPVALHKTEGKNRQKYVFLNNTHEAKTKYKKKQLVNDGMDGRQEGRYCKLHQ